ncbi:hypothetical protein [Undibacterium terreum]|uniref:Uncharacterized protein n=1 Tax=Undibacterium terreum TaxID=1224302 RepID=A0A916UAN7_9BURK|nr:hypothetical protein [Undibacterium terreum]GGC64127.1 hypothetical protein GCM10011396_08850 [Undibacterium terreum]
MQGCIKEIAVDGYERLLTLQSKNETLRCTYIDPHEYLEPGETSKLLTVDETIYFSLALNFVTAYELAEPGIQRRITQDLHDSPHAIVIGEIVEKLNYDSYLLSINDDLRIAVEFEENVELKVADYICVAGELTVEREPNFR